MNTEVLRFDVYLYHFTLSKSDTQRMSGLC